jgi:hypothetical protein
MATELASMRLPEESGAMCREQFDDLWRGTKKPTGETRLMMAVFMQAIDDLRKFSGGVDGSDAQRFYRRARRWMESNDREQPFSFMNISEALDMPVVRVRAHLLGGAHREIRQPTLPHPIAAAR